MLDLAACICDLFRERFLRTFQLAVFVKIFLGILRRSHGRIQRNGNFLIGIIIQGFKRFAAFLQTISVGVDQLAVNLVFVFFGSIFHLLFLEIELFAVSLQGSLHDPS